MADDGRGNEARSIVGDDPDAGGGLRSFLLAALRRLLVLIVVAAALTAIGSLIIGALARILAHPLAGGRFLHRRLVLARVGLLRRQPRVPCA